MTCSSSPSTSTHFEVVYINKFGKETCYGDYEGNEEAALYRVEELRKRGLVAWIERS